MCRWDDTRDSSRTCRSMAVLVVSRNTSAFCRGINTHWHTVAIRIRTAQWVSALKTFQWKLLSRHQLIYVKLNPKIQSVVRAKSYRCCGNWTTAKGTRSTFLLLAVHGAAKAQLSNRCKFISFRFRLKLIGNKYSIKMNNCRPRSCLHRRWQNATASCDLLAANSIKAFLIADLSWNPHFTLMLVTKGKRWDGRCMRGSSKAFLCNGNRLRDAQFLIVFPSNKLFREW